MKVCLYGKELVYDESIEMYLDIRKQYKSLYACNLKDPMKNILGIKGVGVVNFFEVITKAHNEALLIGLEKAIEILYKNGLEYANGEEFYASYGEYINQFDIDIDPIVNNCCNLEEQYHINREIQQLEKMGRSHWVGGGFGLSGAVKGALTAKALNVGMDLFRGISDSEKESKLSQEYKSKRDRLLGSKDTYNLICNALYKEYMRLAECVMTELVNNKLIAPLALETTKAKALLRNTIRYKEPTQEELRQVIIECLQMDPFCEDIYDFLWKTDGDNSDVIKFARYFGMMPDEMIEERLEKINNMDESDIESILKKIEACKKWEIETNEVLLIQIEALLKKLVDICRKDDSKIELIVRRLDIFGESKKLYKTIGELEAIKIFAQWFDGGQVDNQKCYDAVKNYISIKKMYGTNIIHYILDALILLNYEIDDGGVIEDISQTINAEWESIIFDKAEMHSVHGLFARELELPLMPGDKKYAYATFQEEKEYQSYLRYMQRVLEGSIFVWGAAPKHNQTEQALAKEIEEAAEYIIQHDKCVIFYKAEGNKKSRVQELPNDYLNFLKTVVAYVNGAGESPIAAKLKKREAYKQKKIYLDSFLLDCEKVDLSSDKSFDEVVRLLELSDPWKGDEKVDKARSELIKYWNQQVVPQLDDMWECIANKTPKSMDDLLSFQEKLKTYVYLEKKEKQKFKNQIDEFVEVCSKDSESLILEKINNFDLQDFSEFNYNQALLYVEWAASEDGKQYKVDTNKIEQYIRNYEKAAVRDVEAKVTNKTKSSKLPIISLFLGIGALLTSCLCIGGPLGIAGLICGRAALKKEDKSHAIVLAGNITSGIAVLISIVVLIIALVAEPEEKSDSSTAVLNVLETSTEAKESFGADDLEVPESKATDMPESEVTDVQERKLEVDSQNLSVWSHEYLALFLKNVPMNIYDFAMEEDKLNNRAGSVQPETCYLKASEDLKGESISYIKKNAETNLIYIGELKNDKPDGYGQIYKLFNLGTDSEPEIIQQIVYDGMFKKGKYSGFGKCFFTFEDENELIHYREFINDYQDSQECINKYFNEIEYIGYTKDGKYDGKGIFINYPNKQYTSEFMKRVSMKSDEDPNYYTFGIVSAEFEKGDINGYAQVYNNGFLLYDGSMKHSTMDGRGTLYYSNSDHIKYDGDFSSGLIDGNGTLYDYNGNVICSGVWENNMCGVINAEDYPSPVLKESEKVITEVQDDFNDDYILPESNLRYLLPEELQYLSAEELRLARNEIYARHGRKFETDDLKQYFSGQSWYNGYLSAEEFDDSVLNEYEKANLDLIKVAEGEMSGLNSISAEDIFKEFDIYGQPAWVRDSNDLYMIPENDAYEGEIIKFSGEPNTYEYAMYYYCDVEEILPTDNGGLECRGNLYNYHTGDKLGRIQVIWDSFEVIDYPVVKVLEGNTDLAGNYQYHGLTE